MREWVSVGGRSYGKALEGRLQFIEAQVEIHEQSIQRIARLMDMHKKRTRWAMGGAMCAVVNALRPALWQIFWSER